MSQESEAESITDRCPSCGVVGEKSERVGTYKCEVQAYRVHFYQRASEQHDVAVGAPQAGGSS